MAANFPLSPSTSRELEPGPCRIWPSLFSRFCSDCWRPASCKRSFSTGILALALAVAACQPPPRPFLPEVFGGARHKLLQPGAEANLLVVPVQGAPASRALAERVAEALRAQGIAAGTEAASRSSYAVWGMTAPAGDAAPRLWLRWRLLDPNGMPAGVAEHEVAIEPGEWRSGAPAGMDKVAESAARTIAALIRGEAVAPAAEAPRARPVAAAAETAVAEPPRAPSVRQVIETAASKMPAVKARRTVVMEWPGGAPSGGKAELAGAMRRALQSRDFTVLETPEPGSYRLAGQAVQGREKKGEVEIALQWDLMHPGGESIATVSERFSVPRRHLDSGWGELAERAAKAGAETLAEILRVQP